MADSSGKIDVHWDKDKLVLSYAFDPGDPLDKPPTFAVIQKLGWKQVEIDASGDKKQVDGSSTTLRIVGADQVKKAGGKYSFTFVLSDDVTDVVVRAWKDPPQSGDEPGFHDDEDQLALGKDLLNKKTVTVLKVLQGGKLEAHATAFTGSTVDGSDTLALTGEQGSYADGKADARINTRANLFKRKSDITLSWTVADLGDATVWLDVETDPKHKSNRKNAVEVTDKIDKDTNQGTTTVTDPGKKMTFCADLFLKDASGKEIDGSSWTICAFGNDALPSFKSFTVTGEDGGSVISPKTGKVKLLAKTNAASAHSIWVLTLNAKDGKVIEHFRIKDHGEDQNKDAEFELDPGQYPKDADVKFIAGIFGNRPDSGTSEKAKAPWNAVVNEGGFVAESSAVVLKFSWSAQQAASIWLSAGGDEAQFTWRTFPAQLTNTAPISGGTGLFDGSTKAVPLAQLQKINGAARIGISAAGAGYQEGLYTVCKAKPDGTADDASLLISGSLARGEAEILRHVPGDGVVVSVYKKKERPEGKGFRKIKHWFVLMLENRSYDHMLGRLRDLLPEADGTVDFDGNTRSDCFNDLYGVDGKNMLPKADPAGGRVMASGGARDKMLVDPGHEFTHVHMGIHGWNNNGTTNSPGPKTMNGFVATYLNRLLPRAKEQGQWDVDAYDSHYAKEALHVTQGIHIVPSIPNLPFLPPLGQLPNIFGTHDDIGDVLKKSGRDLIDISKDVMRAYDPGSEAIRNLSKLAKDYAVCDRWFSSLPGPTWPNRLFVHCGTAGGLDDSPDQVASLWKARGGGDFSLRNIYDVLDKNGVSWMVYGQGTPQANTVAIGSKNGASIGFQHVVIGDAGFAKFKDAIKNIYNSAAKGTYTFLEPNYGDFGVDVDMHGDFQNMLTKAFVGGNSQHPISGAIDGDKLIADVVKTIQESPVWNESALIITYDEHGGFYDHVPPPDAPRPDSSTKYHIEREDRDPKWKGYWPQLSDAFQFARLGVRVPAIIVSPFVPQGVVDHTVYDHTSVLRTVMKSFNIQDKLSDREAAANDFSHVFALQQAASR